MSDVDFTALAEEQEKENEEFKLSQQAVFALMLALQNSLQEQSDIVPVLEEWRLTNSSEGLVVLNPPVVKVNA